MTSTEVIATLTSTQVLNLQEKSHKRKNMPFATIYLDYLDQILSLPRATGYLAMELVKDKDIETNRVIVEVYKESKSFRNSFYKRINKLIAIGFLKRQSSNVYFINPEASPCITRNYDRVWKEYKAIN